MRVPALPTFFCLLSPDFQRLRAELIRVLARYPPGTGGSRCRLPPGGIEGSHRDRRVGRENDRRASGRPVEGSPRPWLRATDNHGYRRLSVGARLKCHPSRLEMPLPGGYRVNLGPAGGNGRIFVAAAVVLTWTSARAIRPSRTNARRCVPLPDEREPAAPVSITRERLQPEDGASVVRAGRSAERHQTVRGSDVTEHPRFANAPKSLLISVCVYTPGCRCKAFKLFPGGGPAGVATIAHASPKPRRSSTGSARS
jgi:hypothetical protein